MSMDVNKTICGDCIEEMRRIESGSVDLVIADRIEKSNKN